MTMADALQLDDCRHWVLCEGAKEQAIGEIDGQVLCARCRLFFPAKMNQAPKEITAQAALSGLTARDIGWLPEPAGHERRDFAACLNRGCLENLVVTSEDDLVARGFPYDTAHHLAQELLPVTCVLHGVPMAVQVDYDPVRAGGRPPTTRHVCLLCTGGACGPRCSEMHTFEPGCAQYVETTPTVSEDEVAPDADVPPTDDWAMVQAAIDEAEHSATGAPVQVDHQAWAIQSRMRRLAHLAGTHRQEPAALLQGIPDDTLTWLHDVLHTMKTDHDHSPVPADREWTEPDIDSPHDVRRYCIKHDTDLVDGTGYAFQGEGRLVCRDCLAESPDPLGDLVSMAAHLRRHNVPKSLVPVVFSHAMHHQLMSYALWNDHTMRCWECDPVTGPPTPEMIVRTFLAARRAELVRCPV